MSELAIKIKICKLYYEEGLSKVEIAEKTRFSRFKIAKILEDAVADGTVQIKIRELPGAHFELESALEKKYKIYRAIVTDTGVNDEGTKGLIGASAAQQLAGMLQDGDCIGIAWGSTILKMIQAFSSPVSIRDISIIQLTGGLHQVEQGFNPVELTSTLAAKIEGSRLFQLYAPAIVDNREAREILLKETTIRSTMEKFGDINIAVVGIGGMRPKPTTMLYRDGYITADELKSAEKLNLAGDINSHFYNDAGQPCSTIFDERTIGIDLQQLSRIRYVMAVANGQHKVQAIHSALKGRIINILVTDRSTAEAVLAAD